VPKSAILPCEKRVARDNYLVSIGGTKCNGNWTRHHYVDAEISQGGAYLVYQCAGCGHRRVWGTIGGGTVDE
jgi:hypothetical protein